MKKIALVLLLLFYMCVPAYAVNFVEIGEGKLDIIYVDIDSVQTRDGYVVAWSKWIPKSGTSQHNKKVTHTLILYAFNMDYQQLQSLSEIDYDKNGNSLNTITKPFDPYRYDEVIPGSLGKVLYESAMAAYREKIQPEPTPPPSMSYAVGEYLGIVFAPNKTENGYFLVSAVIKGGISDFAGVKAGDIVTKIDTYDLKEHDMERVASYIGLRYRQRAIIKATIDRQGTKKVIEIQL